MMKIYESVTELIGNTPLLKLNRIKAHLGLEAHLLAKLEYFNPGGSVKDRVANAMIQKAQSEGLIGASPVIIEPTSGNTGAGLASVCAANGYRVIIVMPENMSVERMQIMRAYGAELVLTDKEKGMRGAIEKAEELAKEIPNSFIPGQFDNPANPAAHMSSTGPELLEATGGDIDILIAGVGTGGTITGIGRYLKGKIPSVKVIAVEPEKSPVLSKGLSGSHNIQGIGAGFIPSVLDTGVYDEVITVSDEDAYEAGRLMGRVEGVLVGISSGAALHAAIETAKRPESYGKNIVMIMPDTGERYLSTAMYSV